MGYLSLIFLEAKFGAPTRISEANFGAKPPRPPNMEVPPVGTYNFQNLRNETIAIVDHKHVNISKFTLLDID